jgi:hypothetical protein
MPLDAPVTKAVLYSAFLVTLPSFVIARAFIDPVALTQHRKSLMLPVDFPNNHTYAR